jgi:dolichol-phosphate mannosyltransferase
MLKGGSLHSPEFSFGVTIMINGVSIVTTTWNERANIEKLIPTIRNTLQQIPHETIVVDDNSSDGTFQTARLLADVAVTKTREGQTKGLLHGMRLAKYQTIITIDADLENDPTHIPTLIQQTAKYDIVVASRTKLPRISEIIASKTLGKLLGVTDTLSNFRAYRKEVVPKFNLRGGETFGAEFLVIAKKKGLTMGEIKYDPPPRRRNPRIDGKTQANLRIIWALIKSLTLYLI